MINECFEEGKGRQMKLKMEKKKKKKTRGTKQTKPKVNCRNFRERGLLNVALW